MIFQHNNSEFDPILQSIKQLQKRVKNACIAIRRNRCSKKKWILLFGLKKSGKTTLLSHSELELISPHQQSLKNIKNTKTINWWIHKKAVFIDLPGDYCSKKTLNEETKVLWQTFLRSLKKRNRRINTILLTIDCFTLLQHEKNLVEEAQEIASQLQTLSSFVPSIFIVITKCDYLSGFSDFFLDLTPEECKQSFGFCLNNSNKLPFSELLRERFTIFIKDLSPRLFWRLHHERSLNRRLRIKDFPIKLEKVIKKLEFWIENLIIDKSLLSGIYFTSNQQNTPFANISEAHFNFSQLIYSRSQSHFIKGMLDIVINEPTIQLPTKTFKKISFYLLIILIILFEFLFLSYSYSKNIKIINTVKNSLPILTNSNFLFYLGQIEKNLSYINKQKFYIAFNQVYKLRHYMENTFSKVIQNNFVTYLNGILAKEINSTINKKDLFQALRIYLILITAPHLNNEVIQHWFNQYWEKKYPNQLEKKQQLNRYLNKLLKYNNFFWPIDEKNISKAHTVLQKKSFPEIIFSMVDSQYGENQIQISFGYGISSTNIPILYQFENFKRIYYIEIPKFANLIGHFKQIISATGVDNINKKQLDKLINQTRLIYLKNYLTVWQQTIKKIKLTHVNSLKDATKVMELLDYNQSSFWKTIGKILNDPAIQDYLMKTKKFDLIHFISGDGKSLIQSNIKLLNQYIVKIDNSNDPIQASYKAVVQRIKNSKNPITNVEVMATKIPEPFNQLVSTLSQKIWKLMLSNSHQYLNSIWVSLVIPEYQRSIFNKFPVFKDSLTDVALQDFNHFFGPNGVLETFFNSYMLPFVDTSHPYWTWKNLDGERIGISQESLDMINRASMIQKMFYENNPNKLILHFTLTPISLSHNVSHFNLNIGGQLISFTPVLKPIQATWPGPKGYFVALSSEALTASKSILRGPWAWLHLIQKSQIKTTKDPKTFKLVINLEGNTAHYQLTADNPINPYPPSVLYMFRCPGTL